MIPARIDDFIINKVPGRLYKGRSGRGRLETEKSLNYTKLDVAPKPDPHTFHSVVWKPDIALLTQDQIMYLEPNKASNRLETVVDLIAYKKPALKVLEVNLDDADSSYMWFSVNDVSARVAYFQYTFGSVNVKNVEALGLPTDVAYDLAIVETSERVTVASVESIKTLKPLLFDGAFILLVRLDGEDATADVDSESIDTFENLDQSRPPETSGTPSESSASLVAGPTSSVSSEVWDEEATKKSLEFAKADGASSVFEIAATRDSPLAYLSKPKGSAVVRLHDQSYGHLLVARLAQMTPRTLPPSLQATLEASGWTISQETYPFSKHADGMVILVLDELSRPVTKGAQHPVTDPDNAMINGLFRVARQEDPTVKLTTLDVQSSTSPATSLVIAKVLELLRRNASSETEYMERNGMLHVQRIMPDIAVNDFRRAEEKGLEPVLKHFHGTEVQVQLRAERLGTFQGLMWCENEVSQPAALDAGTVEVEVMAIGVNFKDVAITMGIVPDNEYNIGFECAGVVKRFGPGVTKFKAGDRVCMLKAGSYVNRARVSVDRCHVIPSSMSFEEAATIPSVYLCSLYAIYHLGNLKEGQPVALELPVSSWHSTRKLRQVSTNIDAVNENLVSNGETNTQIYVTVGTEEKRKFLESNYGISRSCMFSSRDTRFASEIKRATGGCGVDVIINSLVGELLDASWRIIADGGNMVEIGKRDIVDRNTLSMEPFDRNCSFRAVDVSYTKDIKDSLISSLFDELFVLIDGGHIKPIHPITTFGFDDIIAALSYIRSGRHLGKIVISNSEKEDVQVPIRPAVRDLQLKPDVSYLIVGGLKGACGTLAIHMAQYGASHIIINSRSGINDEASASIVDSCRFYGCEITEARGDIGNIESVRRIFKSSNPRIGGIVQGAMVLRDKPFEMMTLDEYHTAIHAKVHGTWNLHKAAQEVLSEPLHFFTMLSSTSGIIGNKGQANYAAANTFLDAFASYRQGLGLRANTVDLGLIEGVGYVAEQDSSLEVRFDKRYWIPINESMLRKILTYSILQQDASVPLNPESSTEMITGVGFPLPQDGSELTRQPRFSYLFNSRGGQRDWSDDGDETDQTDQTIKEFRLMHKAGADIAALNHTCVEVVSAQFSKILRLETELETGGPLVAYGLDSLSAVELRNWIRLKLGVELTTLDITNASSLVSLCEKVVSKLPQPGATGKS
ncbi:KR domain-containing protein [Xylariaceae sp. FL0662B]|nr:KR domain-containing protein [Xylariaceae sp. FL0662B]